MSPTPTCHHVLANGALCQSLPLRNRDYCRFHLQQIGRRMKAARARARNQAPRLRLPLLEDLYSVQIALMQVADAIAYREIDPQYARLLTTVLRLAMQNLKSKQPWERSSHFQLAGNSEGTVTEWNTFEQDHDLPADLDLSLDPEVAFPPSQETTGAPLNPVVGLSGNDGALRARVSQILHEAETAPLPHVTADDVEILDVFEREGEQAMLKCEAGQQRNRKRRERRALRLHYEEVAHHHNIQLAAKKLLADQRKAAAGVADPALSLSNGLPIDWANLGSAPSHDHADEPPATSELNGARKLPRSEAAKRDSKRVAGEA